MARISLAKITFEANHGVTADERAGTRTFEVDVWVQASVQSAETSDRLDDTIDYSRIADTIVKIGTGPAHHLLESLARQMVDALVDAYPSVQVQLELRKLAPPGCPGHPQHAAVRLTHPS